MKLGGETKVMLTTLSYLRFSGHFPGGPGLAGTRIHPLYWS